MSGELQPSPSRVSGPTSPRIYSKPNPSSTSRSPRRRRLRQHVSRGILIPNSTALFYCLSQVRAISLPPSRSDDWAGDCCRCPGAQVSIGTSPGLLRPFAADKLCQVRPPFFFRSCCAKLNTQTLGRVWFPSEGSQEASQAPGSHARRVRFGFVWFVVYYQSGLVGILFVSRDAQASEWCQSLKQMLRACLLAPSRPGCVGTANVLLLGERPGGSFCTCST